MKLKEGEKHDDPLVKSDSINDTIHKVTVLTPYSFKIGNTLKFGEYGMNGIAKQLKTKVNLQFKSFEEVAMKATDEIALDGNLAIADFEKIQNSLISHICFLALDKFRTEEKRLPNIWGLDDANKFIGLAKTISAECKVSEDDLKDDSLLMKFLYLFSF